MSTANSITQNLITDLNLKAFPSVALHVMDLISVDQPDIPKLSRIINTDATLSAALLRAANSALFAHRSTVANMDRAIQLLGIDRTTLLVQTHAAWRVSPQDLPHAIAHTWWRHNISTALFSQHQSRHTPANHDSYLSGLLHSIGQIALYKLFPAQYLKVLISPLTQEHGLIHAERHAFNTDHCELGAELLAKWNLPNHLIDAAAHHHCPDQAQAPSTLHIHSSCCLSNTIGCTVFPHQPDCTDPLSNAAKTLLADAELCSTIALTVKSLESRLFSRN